MSGEDERSRRPATAATPRPAAGGNPFLDEAPAAAPAKVRRAKPPPGIISAGGVDMARAHASNIRPVADSEQKPLEQAKVVLSAEKTDPRRMRTMRRIDGMPGDSGHPPPVGAGGPSDSPWAKTGGEVLDRAALPSANIARPAAVPVPEKKEEKPLGGFWLRAATVLVILLLVAGVTKRVFMATKRPIEPSTPYAGGPLIPEPLPADSVDAVEPSANGRPATHGTRPPVPGTGDTAAVDPGTDPSAEPMVSAEPAVPVLKVRPPPPPPPPKATFTPLFQLPDEKKN